MPLKGIQIQHRDIELFKLLQRFPFLDSDTIHQLCFSEISKQASSLRIKKLTEYSFLNRIVPKGETRYFYYVTELVREYLENDRPVKKLNRQHLIHDMGLSKMMIHLWQNYPEEHIFTETDLSFMESHVFKTMKEHLGKIHSLSLKFLPDGAIYLPSKNALYFIEYDRSTEHGLKLHQKFFAYYEYYQTGMFKKDFNPHLERFRALMLCKGKQRIEGILKTYASEDSLQLFVLTTHKEFEQATPLHAPIWRHIKKQGTFSLGMKN